MRPLMERTRATPIVADTPQRHVLSDDLHDICGLADSFDFLVRNHKRRVGTGGGELTAAFLPEPANALITLLR